MKIIINNFKAPSMNELMHKHWTLHSKWMKQVKALVVAECMSQIRANMRTGKWFGSKPLVVWICAEYKGSNRRDTDNLYIKPILDGLVAANLIKDDNCDIVKQVEIQVLRNCECDRVSIIIQEFYQRDRS